MNAQPETLTDKKGDTVKKINPSGNAKLTRKLTISRLYASEVTRLHVCARLAGYENAESFFAESARQLIADFESEFPTLFQVGKQFQLLPGTLRVLRALRKGHSTVAEIKASLDKNPIKDAAIRAALKQLVTIGAVRKRTISEKVGAGRPTEIYTLTTDE